MRQTKSESSLGKVVNIFYTWMAELQLLKGHRHAQNRIQGMNQSLFKPEGVLRIVAMRNNAPDNPTSGTKPNPKSNQRIYDTSIDDALLFVTQRNTNSDI